MRKAVNSLKVIKPKGLFSQVLKVGDFVYISNQAGYNQDLEIENNLKDQLKTIFENTKILLSEIEMELNDVVRVVIYTKANQSIDEIEAIYQTYFTHPYPARSLVFVQELSHKDALIELSFDAIDLKGYELSQVDNQQGCNCGGIKNCHQKDR